MPANKLLLSIAVVSALVLTFVYFPSILPTARASSEPAYCTAIGGSWDDGNSTCTLSTNDGASPDTSLEVTSGTTLLLDCSSSCFAQLDFESNGSLTVDQGATVLVESNFTCQSCFDNGIDLDGSGTAIINLGTIVLEPILACTQGSFCTGIDIDGGNVNNSGTIQIEGNYSCDIGSLCYGILNDNGHFVDINCGTTSSQSMPYFDGAAISTSGGCATTTVTQTVNNTEIQTQTITSNSTRTITDNQTLTRSSPIIESNTQTVTSTVHSVSTAILKEVSNVTVTQQQQQSSNSGDSGTSSSENFIELIAAVISIGAVATVGVLFTRKRP